MFFVYVTRHDIDPKTEIEYAMETWGEAERWRRMSAAHPHTSCRVAFLPFV